MSTVPPDPWFLLTVFAVALGLGTIGTLATRTVARRVGFVAKPRAERWHSKSTALAGGVGIFVSFAVVSGAVAGSAEWPILVGASAMFALGFVDDIVQLKPYAKLVGQLLVAVGTVLTGAILPWTPFTVVNQAVTIFWIIGITNAINLLDNMDGLAGGIACISAAFQAVFFWNYGQSSDAVVCAALAGALGGFLVFNFNPASIFMGDSGALFLGYTLSALALHQDYGRSRGLLAIIIVPVFVLLIPIFDTTFVTLTRILRGQPISQGGRDHTSHRLVKLGMSERAAVASLWTIAIVAGAIAFAARFGHIFALWIGVPTLILVLMFVGIHLARNVTEDGPSVHQSVLLSVGAIGYKRRIFETLLDVVLAMVALASAFLLRFDGDLPEQVSADLVRVFPVLVASKVVSLYVTGAYDGIWRYVGVSDVLKLGRGAFLGSLVGTAIVAFWLRFGALSRGALAVDGIIFAALLVASRLSFRALRAVLVERRAQGATRVLLWGADDAGEVLVRQLMSSPARELIPVGFVDDDALKVGRTIQGLRVLGDGNALGELLRKGVADEVIIASEEVHEARVAHVASLVTRGKIRRMRMLVEEVSGRSDAARSSIT